MDTLTQLPGSQLIESFTLTAQIAMIDGRARWTYNSTVPGPELRVNQGDRVRVTLVNHLPESTSIHWHGLRLPNASLPKRLARKVSEQLLLRSIVAPHASAGVSRDAERDPSQNQLGVTHGRDLDSALSPPKIPCAFRSLAIY